ncbi:MAG: AAA family ATPase [Dehalococcoidia bacterium]|nr:AAA family ATPase [Dehalococcoidia bacterium]
MSGSTAHAQLTTSGPFVGREKELERLRKAFDAALAGRGGLVMLVGEPGIGKTRTTEELEAYARSAGAAVLWGRAHESPGAPPYWPWIQVGSDWAAMAAAANVELPPTVISELSRIFPVLGQHPAFVEPRTERDPEVAQFCLFDAYATFIRAIAERAPLVIALDDLQSADKPTLLLLQHIARELSRSRILVVGNYRDTDITRQSPLSESLAVLNRECNFERVVLRGLSRQEVGSYVRERANIEPRRDVLDRIFQQTEGNAFFLSEVVNLMAEEGTLDKELVPEMAIPDGVKEALGRRLSRLSEEVNELLRVATIVGREFSYEALIAMGDWHEDELLELLEEALRARVIQELPQAGRFRFMHALMHEALLCELTTTRRVRLHGQVGEALEQLWGARADQHASRLAEHFVEAAILAPRFGEKAVHYAKLAARQAEAQTAWDEAAKWYERVLSIVTESDDGLDEDEAALRVSLGVCLRNDFQARAAFRNLMRAITLYTERGDGIGVARSAVESLAIVMKRERHELIARDALVQLGGADPHLEARLLLLLRPHWLMDYSTESNEEKRVRDIVSKNHFPDIEGELLLRSAVVALYQLRLEEAAELFAQAERKSGIFIMESYCLPIATGDVQEGVAVIEEALAKSRTARHRMLEVTVLFRLAGLALVRCDFEEFQRLQADLLGSGWGASLQLAAHAELEGDIEKALTMLPDVGEAGGGQLWVAQIRAGRCRVRYLAGDEIGAREDLRACAEAIASYPSAGFNFGRLSPLTELGEALPALADDSLAAAAYEELQLVSMFRWDPMTARGADAIAGALGLRLGRVDAAAARFQTGLDWATRNRLPIEEGRNMEGLAEVAHARGSTPGALELLDRAASIYRQFGARLYLDRVIKRAHTLQQPVASRRQARPTHPDGLSEREVEVLRLIARGQTNAEIAEELFISPHTVGRHVSNIFGKTNTHGRAQATAYALSHGLGQQTR